MEPEVTRLQAKLTELRRHGTQVFGSSTHHYLLNPCLSERQVQEAEDRYGITLPEDYRHFLLFMGNGGAGPDYGILPLEHSLEHSVDDVRFLRYTFPHVQAWNLTAEDIGLVRDRDFKAFDDAYFSDVYMQGALRISTEGCGYYAILVIVGPERGHMWWDGRVSDAGIHPLSAPQHPDERLSFFAWYERWLDQSLGEVARAD